MGDLGKLIVANGFEWLSKVQKIAQSGLTGYLGSLIRDHKHKWQKFIRLPS